VTFRHRRRALHGTRVSHGHSNICSSVIAPLFLSLLITLILSADERVFLLSVNRRYRYTRYVCVACGTVSRGPISFCEFYDVRPTGSRFRSHWRVSGLHGERNSSHHENGTVATRIAPRSFAPDKALPSLPSCLSTLLAVVCCRFTSPFCKCANIRLLSLSYNSHLSLRLDALPLESARLYPRASLFDCPHVQ